jgi:uncharacterized protein (TIGR02452 family)
MRFLYCALVSSFLFTFPTAVEGLPSETTVSKGPENPFAIAERKAKRQARYLSRIFRQTKQATEHGYNVNGKHVDLNKATVRAMQKGTDVINNPKKIPAGQNKFKTQILVTSRDQVAAGTVYLGLKFNPALLNIAHKHEPGDNVWGGKQNLEANFFRISDYFKSLCPWQNKTLKKQLKGGKYDVPTFGVIYSPQVSVFRDSQSKNFVFLPAPLQFGFIASASFNGHSVSHNEFRHGTKKKIRAIFRAAWAKNHDVVVLNDYEVYQHHNNPKEVASLFRDVLKEPEFKGVFAVVDFALTDSTDSRLFLAFCRELEGLKQ